MLVRLGFYADFDTQDATSLDKDDSEQITQSTL
jgi:hypothetical protein